MINNEDDPNYQPKKTFLLVLPMPIVLNRRASRALATTILRWSLGVLALLTLAIAITLSSCASFGNRASGQRQTRIEASPHSADGHFLNAQPLGDFNWGDLWYFLGQRLFGQQIRRPPALLPFVPVHPASFITPPPPGLRAIWLGHSSVLIEMDGLRFLLDPIFSDYASPFQWIGPKRFAPPPIALSDLPPIDAVLISHDHYDHLDMHTAQHLATMGSHFLVPLGIGAHLEAWGIPASQITDLDWWESHQLGQITFVCTPSQHYSGRGLLDRMETLWASWTALGPQHRVFYSGDTGFSDHFQHIGQRFGPFHLGIFKIGAYGPSDYWHDVHIDPEEAIQAHRDVRGQILLPVHWATFNLGLHDWDEPIKRALKTARENKVELVTPRLGELLTVGQAFHSSAWWDQVQ